MKKEGAFSLHLTRGLIVSGENANAIDMARLMREHDIGAVLIVKADRLVGIVSERDIVRRVVAQGLSITQTLVKDFMTRDVITAEFTDGIKKIYQTLCELKCRHLPIMDKGRVVGIASQRDVLYNLITKAR